ncbi:HTTM domain-containing protein [Streptomyces sp. NBC_00091]|uniref:HTTM domain-containing protein n=1 Tax=Streptomyces sp. NBC_00091 TaxID=2975648 RepID=UPI0022549C3A|nr:HTTM domain-containing protein [Streptomyces sp. NBC_00091]MCX5375214.1 HTTM domain-containing protein [Streptomyces sp. NBC_00091]
MTPDEKPARVIPLIPAPAPAPDGPGTASPTRPPAPPAAGAGEEPAPRRSVPELLTAFVEATGRIRFPHQAAVVRIGFAFVCAGFLVREWPHRRILFGDLNPWSMDMAVRVIGEDRAFTVLTWWTGRWWFETVYHATLAAALLLMVGWRTRGTSVFFMVGVLSLEFRSPFLGDGGDNVLRIMAIYLVFLRCADVWSLDARRRRRLREAGARDRSGLHLWQGTGALLGVLFGFPQWGWSAVLWALWAAHGLRHAAVLWFPEHEARPVLDRLTGMLHNCAMAVLALQVCFIYATAGWYKIQGSRWQEGSALYYALHLDHFRPWPWLSELLASGMVPLVVMAYATVVIQVAFPFTLANRRIKNVLLAVMMAEHAGIAVVLGLPFLSVAMIVCDALFLPTAVLLALDARVRRALTTRD